MDVGYFIGELLAQHGEVMVPGLGYFAHTRVNGHYNDREGRIYPPRYSVQFDPQFIDDDTLAQYIADNKSISLASSKYFTEKYVANLRHLATTGDAAIANLGWFFTEDFKLAFRSNNELNTGPDFFGYPPINIYKLGTQPDELPAQPQFNYGTTAPAQVADTTEPEEEAPQFETDAEHEAYLVDLTAKRKRKTLITFVILAILLSGLIYFLYMKYDRSAFNLEEPAKTTTVKKDSVAKPKKIAVVKDTAKKDASDDSITIVRFDKQKTFVAEKDTAKRKVISFGVTPPPDTVATGPHYEILGGSFKTMEKANAAIEAYKKKGFTASVLDNVAGPSRKVTLGSYKTRAEAIAAQRKILATGKIKPAEIYIQPYNVK